jgi:hypothetical protein
MLVSSKYWEKTNLAALLHLNIAENCLLMVLSVWRMLNRFKTYIGVGYRGRRRASLPENSASTRTRAIYLYTSSAWCVLLRRICGARRRFCVMGGRARVRALVCT